MSDQVSFAPALEDPIQAEKIMRVIEKRNFQDYQCYLILKEMQDKGLLMTTEYLTPPDMSDAAELGDRAMEALKERIDLNDQFLKMMAGGE